jgi:putative membrane protein
MGWMGLWWLIGIALVVVLVRVLLVPRGWLGPRGDGESPEQILKRRYAAGEIDRDTYERMRRDLTA